MTQERLAEKAKLSPSYISQIESGRKKIGLASLIKIGEVLDIPLIFLVKDNTEDGMQAWQEIFEAELADCSVEEIRMTYRMLQYAKRTVREGAVVILPQRQSADKF